MSDETKVEEGKDGEGSKHPETVSWSQYVGVKEKLGKEKSDLQTKITSLEEQVKSSVSPDKLVELQKAYDELKGKHDELDSKLTKETAERISTKRETLKTKGIPEEQWKDADESQLDLMLKTISAFKPKADMGSGGGNVGSGAVSKNPQADAVRAYNKQ
jgi:hypothetical protein